MPTVFGTLDRNLKRPTSRGQICDQEAAVQQTFLFEKSSFFYQSDAEDLT